MPHVGRIKIDRLFHQTQPQRLRVEVNVLLRVSGNGGHVVNAVGFDCHFSPDISNYQG
jgi:hypothetical protein